MRAHYMPIYLQILTSAFSQIHVMEYAKIYLVAIVVPLAHMVRSLTVQKEDVLHRLRSAILFLVRYLTFEHYNYQIEK